ncbi:lef-3 [Sucra jujuba nucleopolyhedrovirus]|uniref:Lef-3 n=1 Tax=Sucra jujuba nucleopolyhedrovirus TaxID=1563660 RepID=A0A097P8Z2_9ABAC|nr:lef-3 [Sucra jujuba nucleopolyhedrovirus]AIU41300.1 lef-3 [Sucra jujuba nucleopolyhedrovirus]
MSFYAASNLNNAQQLSETDIFESEIEETGAENIERIQKFIKRKNDDCDVSQSVLAPKRNKNPETEKRLSCASTSSNESGVTTGVVKKNFKNIKSVELISKYIVSLNKITHYLFKFYDGQKNFQYYGNGEQFSKMKLNAYYDLSLTFQDKKIWIEEYHVCQNKNKTVAVKNALQETDFYSNDTVSVYAKFKFGFKTSDGIYKTVYHLLMENNDTVRAEMHEIECTSDFSKLQKVFYDKKIDNENELLKIFVDMQNNMYRLNRIKLNISNKNSKSLSIQSETTIEQIDVSEFEVDGSNEIRNLTRFNNKRIFSGDVKSVVATIAGNESKTRLMLTYELFDSNEESITACLFDNSYENSSKKSTVDFEGLEVVFNQMTDLIENDIQKLYVYVLYDLEKRMYTLLGATRFDIESNQYDSIL